MPFALVGYEVIITNSRYALVGYFITSYPTRAHVIIVIYSRFMWLNGSTTLIWAETERYDIVDFSKVTTKSLASGTGS